MNYALRVLLTSCALLLLSCAIWANVAQTPLSGMRGAWLAQATRGTTY